MLSAWPILLGLALFILRSQMLRIGIRELGPDNLHASPSLGVVTGIASLAGAIVLCMLAVAYAGIAWGGLLIVIGLGLGVLVSALFLPILGNTLVMGMHGGEGDRSIAEFNRAYGHWVAFSVAALALFGLYGLFTFRF